MLDTHSVPKWKLSFHRSGSGNVYLISRCKVCLLKKRLYFINSRRSGVLRLFCTVDRTYLSKEDVIRMRVVDLLGRITRRGFPKGSCFCALQRDDQSHSFLLSHCRHLTRRRRRCSTGIGYRGRTSGAELITQERSRQLHDDDDSSTSHPEISDSFIRQTLLGDRVLDLLPVTLMLTNRASHRLRNILRTPRPTRAFHRTRVVVVMASKQDIDVEYCVR